MKPNNSCKHCQVTWKILTADSVDFEKFDKMSMACSAYGKSAILLLHIFFQYFTKFVFNQITRFYFSENRKKKHILFRNNVSGRSMFYFIEKYWNSRMHIVWVIYFVSFQIFCTWHQHGWNKQFVLSNTWTWIFLKTFFNLMKMIKTLVCFLVLLNWYIISCTK